MAPEQKGRVFYNEQFDGFNFDGAQVDFRQLLASVVECAGQENPPSFYMPSSEIEGWFPGFLNEHVSGIEQHSPLSSFWIGNQTRIAAHYDFPQNLAISAVGRRRFTLFPPEQLENLYVGPMHIAPGGQDISLVDFANPDFDKYPKFEQALDCCDGGRA